MTVLKASVDAFVDQTRPAGNYGQAAYLGVNGDAAATRKSYIFFPRPFPPNAYVGTATLTLTLATTFAGARTFTVKRVTTAWGENTITYSAVPTVTATNSASTVVTSGQAGDQITFDVTAMMAAVSAGGAWYGVEVTVSGTGNLYLYAAEGPDQTRRAALDIDWSMLPEGAINLSPANGQAVSLDSPTLDWEFDTKDHSAIRRQAYSQVQRSTSSSFASPEYDSGQQANTQSNWDLSAIDDSFSLGTFTVTIASPAVFTATGHGLIVGDRVKFTTTGALPTGLTAGTTYYVSAVPGANTFRVSATLGGADVNTSGTQSGTHTLFRFGVPADATRYWRVRLWDDKGQVSQWSDPVSFIRKTKGTLAITNPPAPASNIVNETTPPITWSLTGRTQKAVELRLYQYSGTTKVLKWRLPKLVTSAVSYQIPNKLLRTSEQYNVAVYVWDTIDRAFTPGDPDYVLLSRDFTYQRAGGITAITNLTATTGGILGPAVLLNCHRTALPDYLCLLEDGIIVEDRIDPNTVLKSSGGGDFEFEFPWWGAKQGTSHTYEVEAVQNSAGILKHSSGNDTKTVTPDATGVTLVDPAITSGGVGLSASDVAVLVVGPDSHAPGFTIGEEGTTYAPIGSRRKVRVVDSVGGYEGTISGQVQGSAARNKLLTLKGRSPKPFRLILGDLNIEVELEEVSVSPRGDIPNDALSDCSFAFYQTDADRTFTVTGIG